MSALRPFFSMLSPGGKRGRLSIFIFHRVLPEADAICHDEPDRRRFEQVLAWIASWFNVLPLDEAVARLRRESLPARAAAITFDDGYADNYSIAFPILKKAGLPATFFIATGFLDGGRMWNDSIIEAIRLCRLPEIDLEDLGLGRHGLDSVAARRKAIHRIIDGIKYRQIGERLEQVAAIAEKARVVLPEDLMMSSANVQELARAGMQIGAHTVHHPILASLSADAVEAEIAGGKERLEHLTGERIGLFAYPNGRPGTDFRPADAAIVRKLGFDAAVTTAPGAANACTDLMQIPRFTPWDRGEWRFGARLLANYFTRPEERL